MLLTLNLIMIMQADADTQIYVLTHIYTYHMLNCITIFVNKSHCKYIFIYLLVFFSSIVQLHSGKTIVGNRDYVDNLALALVLLESRGADVLGARAVDQETTWTWPWSAVLVIAFFFFWLHCAYASLTDQLLSGCCVKIAQRYKLLFNRRQCNVVVSVGAISSTNTITTPNISSNTNTSRINREQRAVADVAAAESEQRR